GNDNVVDTSSGDAIAENIESGKKAWVDGIEIIGTIAAGNNVSGTDGQLIIDIPDGLYSATKTATASDTNLIQANICTGKTIFGVAGSASCN
ncbi:MAG: hypothetical protein KZQ83_09100, partial [gamma proteobacterium symbiont of Taylorina sp.]|nr:hypothetical protein [gamma proteobacterium symbiont of Taylorina sp.]